MNTQERILKLQLGGNINSRIDLKNAKAAYENTLAKMTDDPDSISRQDQAAKYLESITNVYSGDPNTNKRARHRAAEAYRIATQMLTGDFKTAAVVNPYTGTGQRKGGYADADNTAVQFSIQNNINRPSAVSTGMPSGKLQEVFDFQWNKGLTGESLTGESDLKDRVASFAQTLLNNINEAEARKNQNDIVNGKWDPTHIIQLENLLGGLNNGSMTAEDAYNILGPIAQYYGESKTHWDGWFSGSLPELSAAETNWNTLKKKGYTKLDLSTLSKGAQNLLKKNKLNIAVDKKGNYEVFDKDWKEYQGTLRADYDDDWVARQAGGENYTGYHDAFVIDDDNTIHFGNLDAGDLSEEYQNILKDIQSQRKKSRNQLHISLDWDPDTDSIDDNFINKLRLQYYTTNGVELKFKGHDLSKFFRGDERVFAVNPSGELYKEDQDGNLVLNPNTIFYVLNSNGEIEKKTWNDIKHLYDRNGFEGDTENASIDTKLRFDESALENLKYDFNEKSDLGGREYRQIVAKNRKAGRESAGFLMNIPIVGTALDLVNVAGNELFSPTDWGGLDNVEDDRKAYVLNVLNALTNPAGELHTKLRYVTNNAELLNNIRYDSDRENIEGWIIDQIYRKKTVPLSSIPAQLKPALLAMRKRVMRDNVRSNKTGGILFAREGVTLDIEGRDVKSTSHMTSAEKTAENIFNKMESDRIKANTEGYSTKLQMDASKVEVFKGDDELKSVDYMRLSTMAQDVASIVASFVPGAGTGVAAGLGVTSMLTDLAADISDPAVSSGEVLSNLGINAGFAVLGMVPGAKAGKVLKNCIKWAPRIAMAVGTMGIAMDPSSQKTLDKLQKGGQGFNREDWRNLSHMLSLVAAGTRGARNMYKRHSVKGSIANKDSVTLKGIKDTVTGKDMILTNKQVTEINAKLAKAETLEDAKAVLAGITNEGTTTRTFADSLIPEIIAKNGWTDKLTGKGKFSLDSEKFTSSASKEATDAAYNKLRELWNEDAKALQELSKSFAGQAAIKFANAVGGGAYGANLRAILSLENISPELLRTLQYSGKYNPMIDWKGRRKGIPGGEELIESESQIKSNTNGADNQANKTSMRSAVNDEDFTELRLMIESEPGRPLVEGEIPSRIRNLRIPVDINREVKAPIEPMNFTKSSVPKINKNDLKAGLRFAESFGVDIKNQNNYIRFLSYLKKTNPEKYRQFLSGKPDRAPYEFMQIAKEAFDFKQGGQINYKKLRQ